jgi:DnaJ-class molecular chaperone
MSLYECLGLSKGADSQEIRRAYLKLSKTEHPDKGGSEEGFKRIQSAYEILSDDDKRAFYDQTGQIPGEEQAQGGMPGGMAFPFDLGSMFGGMFGGGMPFPGMGGGGRQPGARQKRPKGSPKIHEIGLTLHDFFYGKKIQINFERQKFCEGCKGLGAERFETCNACNGSGVRETRMMIGPGMQAINRGPCNQCNAEGKLPAMPCSKCHGKKFKNQDKTLFANIEPGMAPGDVMKFPNECSDNHDFEEPGDVHIVLREADETSVFSRMEGDLSAPIKISLSECLLGTTRVLNGHPGNPQGLTVTIPAGSNSGDIITVVGEGMPLRGTAQRGNLQLMIHLDIKAHEKEVLLKNQETLKSMF